MYTILVASILFLVLLVVGYLLTLVLSKKKLTSANAKELRIKMLMWVPIYALFALFVVSNQFFQVLVALFLAYSIIKEVRLHLKKGYPFTTTYFALFVGFGLVSVWLMASFSINTTIGLVFATMLSEEMGYFGDSLTKKKKRKTKKKYRLALIKSKESLFGQIVGAGLGVGLTYLIVGHFDLWIVLPAFIGVFVGDAINRLVKSRLKISSWSNKIKGHGGYLDRFAGLSFAAVLVYIFYFL